ncbi:MAG: hypothetical protein IPG64_19640 [Haliea sp.]|nr:hypothetical protein [Haliea sp.]
MSPPNATRRGGPNAMASATTAVVVAARVQLLGKNSFYVFAFTDYPHYLFSGFGGYWDCAMQRYQGVNRDEFQ